MRKIAGDAEVCQTCLLFAAGYDAHELGYQPTREPLALVTGYVSVPGDAEAWFSFAECEGCGEPLAGDRYTIHLMANHV
jgi:hypothetical protein